MDQNAKNLLSVLTTLKSKGCGRIIVSGSVFEPFEGGETEGIAHSLYGLSKGLTSQVFHAYARSLGLAIGKFVIPNPFGPLEEFRFTSYLAHSWLNQKIPMLINPYNICDNIPIELLSDAYVSFSESNQTVCRPSGFVETQREFANRFASAMRPRLGLTCHFMTSKEASSQSAFKRFNQQDMVHHWDETVFWDRLAKYYLDMWGERS